LASPSLSSISCLLTSPVSFLNLLSFDFIRLFLQTPVSWPHPSLFSIYCPLTSPVSFLKFLSLVLIFSFLNLLSLDFTRLFPQSFVSWLHSPVSFLNLLSLDFTRLLSQTFINLQYRDLNLTFPTFPFPQLQPVLFFSLWNWNHTCLQFCLNIFLWFWWFFWY
jgi:hypothetical protein